MAIQEGTYKAEFRTPLGFGAGIVVVRDGKIRGGDSGMYYRGSYTESGDTLTAELQVRRHTVTAAIASVFGRDDVTVQLKGQVNGASATVVGTSPQAPGLQFSANLTRIDD